MDFAFDYYFKPPTKASQKSWMKNGLPPNDFIRLEAFDDILMTEVADA